MDIDWKKVRAALDADGRLEPHAMSIVLYLQGEIAKIEIIAKDILDGKLGAAVKAVEVHSGGRLILPPEDWNAPERN